MAVIGGLVAAAAFAWAYLHGEQWHETEQQGAMPIVVIAACGAGLICASILSVIFRRPVGTHVPAVRERSPI